MSGIKGKDSIQTMSNLKPGDYVTIRRARPRRKYRRPDKEKFFSSGKYFRVMATNDNYGCFLTNNSAKQVAAEDASRINLMVNGYKTSDIYDLRDFMTENFPQMIDDFLKEFQRLISPEDIHYEEIVTTLTNLKTALEDIHQADFSDELYDRCKKVWSDFGKIFFYLWS